MGHFSPTGATRPFSGAIRRVPTFRTTERGWTEIAIDHLLNYEDIVVDNVFIDARLLSTRGPVWPQLRQRLAEYGIKTPREPYEPRTREEAVALLRARFGL
jgi:hypothetical protein